MKKHKIVLQLAPIICKTCLFLLDATVGHHYIPPHFAGIGGRLSSLNAVPDAITELET